MRWVGIFLGKGNHASGGLAWDDDDQPTPGILAYIFCSWVSLRLATF